MGYCIVIRLSNGESKIANCRFADQKNVEALHAFQIPKAVEIEIIATSDKSQTPSVVLEKWEKKKSFFNIFGTAKWKSVPIVRDIIR